MDNLYYLADGNRLFRQYKVSDCLLTEYNCPEERSVFDIWSHQNYFVYVLEGKKKWVTMHSDYLVREGEAIFVKKGANIIHKFFEKDFCALIILLSDEFIKTVVENHPIPDIPEDQHLDDSVYPLYLNARLDSFFQSLFAYFLDETTPPRPLLKMKFKELVLNLLCSTENCALCHYFRRLCHDSRYALRMIMEENFAYNLTLEEFARLSNRSLSTFKKDFAGLFGMPPGQWLKEKRLTYSRHLLETSDKSVKEVAFYSGFTNTSHFIRVFRRRFGQTPLQYSKSHQPDSI